MVKERPILFSGEMVNAILQNRKFQTRRVIKPQPRTPWDKLPIWVDSEGYYHSGEGSHLGTRSDMRCPYGAIGDRLWVRETWAHIDGAIWYAADGIDMPREDGVRLRPSIFMPRWASRLTLQVTGVKAERLHRIGELSAKAEGVTPKTVVSVDRSESYDSYCAAFIDLWDSINGKSHPWESNPWVWVIEFKEATS